MALRRNHPVLRSAPKLGLLLLAAASCGADGSGTAGAPTTGAGSGTTTSTAGARELPPAVDLATWNACVGGSFKGDPSGDPRGQGRELLGVGFIPKAAREEDRPFRFLARVDRFDIKKVTLEDGSTPVQEVKVAGHALTGEVDIGGTVNPIRGAGWNKVLFEGKLRCLKGPNDDIPIRARLNGATPWKPPASASGQEAHALEGAWVYKLELDLQDGPREWVAACNGDKEDTVLPIPGHFERDGEYEADADTFSFACMKKDAAKCEDQGYLPDESTNPKKLELFVACTRMMRADYCGNGGVLTQDGSTVDMWDSQGISRRDHEAGADFGFEAAWDTRGAVCVKRRRWAPQEGEARMDEHLAGCLGTKPTCETEEQARTKFPDKLLLFNNSCVSHPCRGETFSSPSGRDAGPTPPR